MPEESQLQMFQTLSVWTPCADRNSLGLPPIHLCPSAAPPSSPAWHQAFFSLTTMSNPSIMVAGKNPVGFRRLLSRLFYLYPACSRAREAMSTLGTTPTNESDFAQFWRDVTPFRINTYRSVHS